MSHPLHGKLVTVFGASGFVGTYVVRALCKAGARVRAVTRRPHLAHTLRVMGDVGQVQLMQANVRNRDSVERALEGADACVNLVGILFQAGHQTFDTVHAEAAEIVAQAAREAGVTALVHMSALGADVDGAALYARSKGDGEARVRAAVPSAVIVRPSIVFGEEDAFFNRFADMARLAPALPLIGGGKTRFQPVYVGDVADAIVAGLSRSDAAGRTFELGGPRIYTFKELMKFVLSEIDRPRFLAPVPFFAALGLGIMGETAGRLPFVEPFITRDQVTLLKRDNVVGETGDDTLGTLADLGVTHLETVESIVPAYLERYRKHGQFHETESTV